MSFPRLLQRLFQNYGAGDKLNPEIIPADELGLEKTFLPLAGGTFPNRITFIRNAGDLHFNASGSNEFFTAISGGTSESYSEKAGAALILEGRDGSSAIKCGAFSLAAADATNGVKALLGYPDGTFTWAGNPVVTNKQIASGVCRYSDGLQLCWGQGNLGTVYKGFTGLSKSITFSSPFKDATYGVVVSLDVGQSGFSYHTAFVRSRTSTGFTISHWWNEGGSVYQTVSVDYTWVAIGQWQ